MMSEKKSIEDFKNEYENERIFLIGNGPSLDKTPLNKLANEYSLAVNRICGIYSKTNWRPTIYYNSVPPRHSADGVDEKKFIKPSIDEADICFIDSEWSEVCGSHDNVFYIDRWWIDSRTNPFHNLTISEAKTKEIEFLYEFWSDNIDNFVYHYHVMYGAIQLATYLGFDEIYFVGCDLGYEYVNPHMVFDSGLDPFRFDGGKYSYVREGIEEKNLLRSLVNGIAMKLITKFSNNKFLDKFFDQEDDSHFGSDYLTGLSISAPIKSEKELRKSHVAAKRICENNGVDMYNATIGGELEIYERVDLENLL